jgi:hypothetical protein
MNDEVVRAVVREAIARHLGGPGRHAPAAPDASPHASHALYLHLVNDTDACLIEPVVKCNHCGYCKTHGH